MPSDRRTIELRIAGQKYRVVSSANEEELHHLAGVVSSKLDHVAVSSRAQPSHAMLLVALALAHEAEAERGRRRSLEERTRELLTRLRDRIDETLENGPGEARGGESK
jgi:cell division protein ZapA